jgi:hypothetical protein
LVKGVNAVMQGDWRGSDGADVSELWAQALAEAQEAAGRARTLGLRRLSPGLTGIIWVLRLYVLFMLGVVAWNLATMLR